MYDKCNDCITPPGTRCESHVSNCPYRRTPFQMEEIKKYEQLKKKSTENKK